MNIRLISTCAAALTLASLSPVSASTGITQDGSVSWIRTNAPGIYNASASDKLVVVISGEHNFAGNLTGKCNWVTYNDRSLMQAVQQLPSAPYLGGHGQTYSSIWYLDNPGNYSGTGTIVVNCTGTSWVATAIGLSGTLPGVGSTANTSGTASVGITTTTYGTMVIAATGMGGQGNTASPLPGVTATLPSQAVTIDGLKIGSNWAGHAVARSTIAIPSTQTITFNTAKTDVCTVAAAFEAADPVIPEGPVPAVHDIVPGESVKLVWANYLPNTGDHVWVDVWIGDDPASLVKVVSAGTDGLDRNSYIFEAPAPRTYHGRIDSYLDGSPTGTPQGGLVFSFEVSDTGLLAETWIGLRPLATILTLQREGIAVRQPDTSQRVASSTMENLAAPAGVRLRGLLTPKTGGLYVLSIAGSQNAALWLSTDDSRFHKQRIAWHLGTTAPQQWNKHGTQQSVPIELQADQSYYIEAQVMNPSGIGHVAIGWKPPRTSQMAPIPATCLSYLPTDLADNNDNNLPDWWEQNTDLDQITIPGDASEYGDPDRDGILNFDEFRYQSHPLLIEDLVHGLTRETWTDISGPALTAITTHFRFYDLPNEIAHVPGIDDALRGEQYGARYRGFLIAPYNGSYRFWITGNDEVQLWLADGTVTPLGDPVPRQSRIDRFGKRLIARNEAISSNIDWGTRNQFDRSPSQRSQVIQLEEGERYYIEVLHKQGWGATDDHVSVAWQPPGQAREIIPATAFIADIPHDADLDDDGLPDNWQNHTDNNLGDPALGPVQRGQFGDPDGDGLINLLEYQYGTKPRDSDTDDDTLTDYAEIFHYGTDPLVPNDIDPQPLATFPVIRTYNPAATTGGWTENSDGTLSAWDARGKISYTFEIVTPGIHEIVITGSAIGDVRPVERLPLVLSLNGGAPFSSLELVSQNGGPGTVKTLTPWLAPGNHTLTILHDNLRALRRLCLHSIAVVRLGGISTNPTGYPDWTLAKTAEVNKLTRVPIESRTSPACVEGIASSLAAVSLSYTPHGTTVAMPIDSVSSVNYGFFANIPLSPAGDTTLHASFINGLLPETETLTWIPTNLFEFNQQTLHIRVRDSLLLDSWSGSQSDAEPFTVTLNGTPLADGNQNTTHTSGEPFTAAFTTPGSFTLEATHDGQTSTVVVRVHSADFGPAYSVSAWSPRPWTPPVLDALHLVEHDDPLILAETTANPATGPRTFIAAVQRPGKRQLIARLPAEIQGAEIHGAPSAILARGTVNGFQIANVDQTSDPKIVLRYGDGTWLMSTTLIAIDLPPDILIRITTVHQGTVFMNGSNTLELRASDFDANGIATIYYEWAGTGDPLLCHKTRLYVNP